MSDHLIAEANRHAKALPVNPDRLALALALQTIDELESENAALRGALEQAEDALRHALIMSPLDPFQRGKVISAAIDVARAALNAARREGTP